MRTIIYNLHFVRVLTCLFERSYNKVLIKISGNYKKNISVIVNSSI